MSKSTEKIGVKCSGQDNTEPLMQFLGATSSDYAGSSLQKSSFLQTHYRIYNINLARKLENCAWSFHPTIEKAYKDLSCCSNLALIEYYHRDNSFYSPEASILKTSPKCRHKLCPRCNSIKSAKYKRRFIAAMNDKEAAPLFQSDISTIDHEGKESKLPKYFYFITLTMKHDLKGNRSVVFLDELKGYMTEFRRSKVWKKYFPYKKDDPITKQSGYAQNYELTLTENGFNIHSHILMCCPRIKTKAMKVKEELKAQWNHYTKDDSDVRFDLVKMDADTLSQIKEGTLPTKFSKYVSECFKYTVKGGSIKTLDNEYTITNNSGFTRTIAHIDLMAQWLIETKRKRMLTSNGFFKGLGLFSTNKNKWDKIEDGFEPVTGLMKSARYLFGRTANIKYNFSPAYSYGKLKRRVILERVRITEIPPSFHDITPLADEFEVISEHKFGESWEKMGQYIKTRKEELAKLPITQDWVNRITPVALNEDAIKEHKFIQKSLFDDW